MPHCAATQLDFDGPAKNFEKPAHSLWGESLKMPRFPKIFHDFFGGMGNVGSPESLKMLTFSSIFHYFFGGMGNVGSPESLKMQGFPTIFMISLVEWGMWGAQNH